MVHANDAVGPAMTVATKAELDCSCWTRRLSAGRKVSHSIMQAEFHAIGSGSWLACRIPFARTAWRIRTLSKPREQ
jgi:hypothetical protein